MTKAALAAKLRAKSDVKFGVRDSEQTVQIILETIRDAIRAGDTVTLKAFGTFTPTTRAANAHARNPHTGEQITVPAKPAVRFKKSSKFFV